MEPTKLFKAILLPKEKVGMRKDDEKQVFIVAEDMIAAANKLAKVLAVDEELQDISIVSETCYV